MQEYLVLFKVPFEIKYFRIANQETTTAAWDILKQKSIGDKQVRLAKLQGLRRKFEYILMGEVESFSVYLVKLFDLINQMKSDGEEISNQRVVHKLLISLRKSYDSIAPMVEKEAHNKSP